MNHFFTGYYGFMVIRLMAAIFFFLLGACAQPLTYDASTLQSWNEIKAELGPTFSGSPAWQAHMNFVEDGLADAGVLDVEKLFAPYTRWWAEDNPDASQRALKIGNVSFPVASYWAYSGSTPPEGVSAPLLVYEKGLSRETFRGRILVFEVNSPPASMARMFSVGHEYATDDFSDSIGISNDQWYQGNYVTRFGRFDELLKGSGALGAIVVFSMSQDRLAGLYTFPLFNLGVIGVPGIYVDAAVGAEVLNAAKKGEVARLTLLAETEEVKPYFYSSVLPGRNYGLPQDEEVLLVTHSDGPNLTQENGTLGILALVREFAKRPQVDRPRTLRVLLDPQHYSPGRHIVDWYDLHPEVMRRLVAVLGVEHIGQLEYGENEELYGLTGREEPWLIYARNDKALISAAIDAIKKSSLPLTELRVPEKKGQGRWTGLAEIAIKRDIKGYATLSNMSGYWGTSPGIESFDSKLGTKQIDTLVLLLDNLMAIPAQPNKNK